MPNFVMAKLGKNTGDMHMSMTFAEKILAKYAGLERVVPNQIVTVKPDHLLTHDNTAAIIGKIGPELEKYGVADVDLNVIVIDHVVPAASEKTAINHKSIREFVSRFGVKNFFDVGEGICHQVTAEKGLALPGSIIRERRSIGMIFTAVTCWSLMLW